MYYLAIKIKTKQSLETFFSSGTKIISTCLLIGWQMFDPKQLLLEVHLPAYD